MEPSGPTGRPSSSSQWHPLDYSVSVSTEALRIICSDSFIGIDGGFIETFEKIVAFAGLEPVDLARE
jgi:hypothetical protein